MASELVYDFILLILRSVFYIFFREVYPRGAHNIPREGPVILAIAPHHNQFLDFHVAIQVWKETGRRTRFLVAASSMKMRVIGFVARLCSSIPVARAQDYAKTGIGKVMLSDEDPLLLRGEGTRFTSQLAPRMQVVLPKSVGSIAAEVMEVISDTEVKLKREFADDGGSATVRVREATAGKVGLDFKALPHVDQAEMYRHVHNSMSAGQLMGIFPEGGSHDRPGLLPLKAGVAMMALGSMVNDPSAKVKIVPTGLSYFHAHMFRSRCVMEFGTPIDISEELVEMFKAGGEQKRTAVSQLMNVIEQGLHTVTLGAPDFETLMVTQAARRLYETPGRQPSLGQVVEMNRRFLEGYLHFKDEPLVVALREKVMKYNRAIRDLGLRDHQVPRAERNIRITVSLLAYRSFLLVVWSFFALLGFILNAPIFLTAAVVSRRKAKEALAKSTVKIQAHDVIGTWKVLISLCLAPLLYTSYALLAAFIANKAGADWRGIFGSALAVLIALPFINFAALKFGEAGTDVLKSLRPLIVNLAPGQQRSLQNLKKMRAEIANELADVVETFGPKFYPDFDDWRAFVPSANAPPSPMLRADENLPRRRRTGQGHFLLHPMSWLDEKLFGWRSTYQPATPGLNHTKEREPFLDSTPNPSDHESDVGDYDDVLGQTLKVDASESPKQGSYRDLQRLRRLRSRVPADFS